MTESNQYPLFFKNPVPIQDERHAKSGLSIMANFKFAKPTNSVPINIQEFALIAKSYPIVFTGDDNSIPAAVLGLEGPLNLFVNKDGKWEQNHYIPAYVRQYPFVFMAEGDKLILCVDEESERFKKVAAEKDPKFYNKKEQSDVLTSALQFCADYFNDQKGTKQFAKALQEKNLLIDRQINVNLEGKKKPVVLGGFKIVDEDKLGALDNDTIIDWYKKGYLALIIFHLQSMTNWQNLVDRV